MIPRVASLCSGYGGLDLAVELAFGDVEHVFTADIDAAACTVLAERFPGVPNVGNIVDAGWGDYIGSRIDVLTGGWPCQPWSLAGKRKGADDARAIWPAIADAVRVLRPRLVFLENVAAIAPAGELARAVGALAALGYVGSWRSVRAADIGAPHQRDRIFILAQREGDRWWPGAAADTVCSGRGPDECVVSEVGECDPAGGGAASQRQAVELGVTLLPTPTARDNHTTRRTFYRGEANPTLLGAVSPPSTLLPTPDATHGRKSTRTSLLLPGAVEELLPTPAAVRSGRQKSPSPGAAIRPSLDMMTSLLPTPRATDGTKGGPNMRGSGGDLMLPSAVQEGRWGKYAAAIARWEELTGHPAPEPTEPGRTSPRLAAPFVEWMMGLPGGWVTDLVKRNDALRLLGNGVVPAQGAYALRLLAATLGATW